MIYLQVITVLLLLVVICQRGIKLWTLKEIRKIMASQEERLQAISTKIDEVLADLATLKTNNPDIEDEIAAIEAKLSMAPTEPSTEV